MTPSNEQPTNAQQPVVIKQGGSGFSGAGRFDCCRCGHAVNVWSTTKKKRLLENLQQGIERVKEGVGKAIESRRQ